MAEPARKPERDIEPDIRPNLSVIKGGGETTPDRANLRAVDDMEAHPETPNTDGDVAEREQNPDAPWKDKTGESKYGGQKFDGERMPTAKNLRAVLKKKGPLGVIITLITVLGGGVSFFGIQALLPIDILSNVVQRFDAQNTTMTIRTNKLIADKISGSTTTGSCNLVQILCRYSRPSNKLLNGLEANGITALDGEGKAITSNKFFPNKIPKTYQFTDSSGNKITVAAKDFSKTLANNSEFRAAFHTAYNPRYVGYADANAKAVRNEFGVNEKDSLADSKNEDDLNKTLDSESTTEDPAVKSAIAEGGTVAEKELETELEKTGTKTLTEVAESGKGNAFGLVAGAVCAVGDLPGLLTSSVRAYQLVQLIKYGFIFLTFFSAVKAGDATAAESTAVLGLLTAVVDKHSTMDSLGMRNTLYGDTSIGADTGYWKYSPGAVIRRSLNGITSITSNPGVKESCSVAINPATGVAIDAATSETGVGPIVNAVVGTVASIGLIAAAPTLIKAAMPFASQFIQPALAFFSGDLTKGLAGMPAADAAISGISNFMGQVFNHTGGIALDVPQAVAYNGVSQQVNLAYAQEDRATHSPLDASNPNTMLGSIVAQFTPYYSQMGSISGVLSTIGSIVTGSLGSLAKLTTASAQTTDASQYTMCDDPALDGVAAGPFCNIQYGIPVQYLNEDPATVTSDLIASGDIDPNTGDPIDKGSSPATVVAGAVTSSTTTSNGGLKAWMDLCLNGTTDQAANCKIGDSGTGTDKQNAEYALYTIDHPIQQTMDGEDTTLDPPTTTDTTTSSSTAPAGGSTTTDTSTPTATDSTANDTVAPTTTDIAPQSTFDSVFLAFFKNLNLSKTRTPVNSSLNNSTIIPDSFAYVLAPRRYESEVV